MRSLFLTRYSPKSLILIIVIILVALTFSAISARTWYRPASNHAELPLPTVHPTPTEQIQTELITVTPRGFEPQEITRPAGKFLLTVNDRSALKGLTLQLINESGQMVSEKELPEGKLAWREILNLAPGNYTLRELDHPDWICNLTISAN